MNLNELISQLTQLKRLLESQSRDCDTVRILCSGEIVDEIKLVDDDSGQDNLNVELF